MRRSIAARWACAVVCSRIMFAGATVGAQAGPGSLWVAVAVSSSTGNYGASTPQPSSDAASQMALKYCGMYGAKDCKISGVSWNLCVAEATPLKFVVGTNGGSGWDHTRELAAARALSQCKTQSPSNNPCVVRVSPCYSDDPRWASPLPLPTSGFQPGTVDPDLVGYWKANVSGGMWILQIAANGTYTFHSAAPASPGNQPMHNGTFTTSNGNYTMHAISIVFDTQGTYTIQGSSKGTLQMNGKDGSSTWFRTGLDPDP
jgi:Domain of unknown function (DUF4189)